MTEWKILYEFLRENHKNTVFVPLLSYSSRLSRDRRLRSSPREISAERDPFNDIIDFDWFFGLSSEQITQQKEIMKLCEYMCDEQGTNQKIRDICLTFLTAPTHVT